MVKKKQNTIFQRPHLVLALIILLGMSLRFYSLPQKGVTGLDEATYLQEGMWLAGDDPRTGMEDPFYSFKPGFSYAVYFSEQIFGYTDFAGHFVSAVFGTLSIVLIYMIATLLYDKRIGLISAFIFALTPLEIIFSRKIYSEPTMMFFFLLSILVYLIAQNQKKTSWKLYILVGLFAGFSYLAKFVGALVLLPLFLYELYLVLWKNKKWQDSVRQYLLMLSGFFIVFIAIWMIYVWVLDISYSYFLIPRMREFPIFRFIIDRIPFITNLPRWPNDMVAGKNPLLHFLVNLFYLYKTVSIVLLPLFLIGFYRIIKRRNKQDMFLFLTFALMFLFVSAVAYFPRTLLFITPFIAIISARSFDMFMSKKRRSAKTKREKRLLGISQVVLLLIILLSSLVMVMQEITKRYDSYVRAREFYSKDDAGLVLSTDHSITSFYTRGPSISVHTLEELRLAKEQGYTHLSINTHHLSERMGVPEDSIMYMTYQNLEPARVIPLEMEEWRFPFAEIRILESLNSWTGLSIFRSLAGKARSSMMTQSIEQELRIYRIDDILEAYDDTEQD